MVNTENFMINNHKRKRSITFLWSFFSLNSKSFVCVNIMSVAHAKFVETNYNTLILSSPKYDTEYSLQYCI